jgi:uncharacterized membrane protein YgcG
MVRKGVFLLIFGVFILSSFISAATIFSDDFESGTLGGWGISSASGANNWTASSTNPYQGTWHAQSQPSSTTEPASVIQRTISTGGYTGIVLNYSRRLIGIDAADEFQVEWYDGTSWTIVEQTAAGAADDVSYVSQQFSLGSGANNNSAFAIKFECTAGAVSEFCRVDNVLISGTLSDSTPPTFSGYVENPANNSAYVQGQIYEFNVTVSDTSGVGFAIMQFNGVNYTGSSFVRNVSNVYIFNRTDLAAGSYSYKWFANDTNGNLGVSDTRNYEVAKTSGQASLLLNGQASNASVVYNTPANASASTIYGSVSLYRNGLDVTSENNQNITLGVSSYNYTAVSSGDQNHSSSVISYFLDITKATPTASLTNSQSWNTNYGVSATIGSSESNLGDSDLVYSVYRDGVNKGTSESIVLGVGSYSYILNTSGGQNYTGVSVLDSNTFVINKTNPATNMLITITPSSTVDYGTLTSADSSETNLGDADLVYNLYRNDSGAVSDPNVVTLNAGVYNYVFNTTGGANYTSGSVNATLIVNRLSNPIVLLLNGQANNLSITTNDLLNVSAYSLSGIVSLFRNSSNVDSENRNNVVLTAGFYVYFANSSGSQNYLENTSGASFFVNVSSAPDTLGPIINILSPEQTVYFSNLNLNLNFSVSDLSGVSACWYSVEGINISLNNCENTTFNVSSEGDYTLIVYANDSLGNLGLESVLFRADLTGVRISISEPLGTKSSRLGIPLTYSTLGNNLSCWYRVKTSIGGEVIPNTSLVSCTNSSFDVSNDGDYVFTLFGNNSFGTENSSTSNFSVSTLSSSSSSSSGGGGSSSGSGGGAGIAKKINLEAGNIPDLTISQGGVKKVNSWKVKNIGTSFLNDCKFKSIGVLSGWIPYTETKGLAAGEEYEFVFDINIPANAEAGEHSLEVFLDCNEINKTGEFVVEILGKQLEFIITNVERQDKDKVSVGYGIENLVEFDQSVDLQFLLFDLDKKQVADVTKSVFIPARERQEFETIIPIDENLQGELSLLINVNSETYSTFVQENIILGKTIGGFAIFGNAGTRDKMISGLIVLLFLGFTFMMVRKIRGHHKIIRHEHLKRKYAFLYNAEL